MSKLAPIEKARRDARRYDRVIKKIQEWAEIHGVPPKVNDWRHVSDPDFIKEYGENWPSYLTAIRYSPDGTWDGVIRAAGFEPRGRGHRKDIYDSES